MEYKIINVEQLVDPKRRDKRPHIVEQLKESIQNDGYDPAHPLTVIQENGHYVVADGNHRLNASILLDIQELPCVIREGSVIAIGMKCNERAGTYAPEDLFDKLDSIQMLRDQGMTQQQIGDVVGMSTSSIKNYDSILNRVVTNIIKQARLHQEGRVATKDTTVTYNFTEGWFRNSGIYENIPAGTRANYRAQMELINAVLGRTTEKDKRFGETEKKVTTAWVKKQATKLGWYVKCFEYAFSVLDKKVKLSQKKALVREIRNGVYGEKENEAGQKKLERVCMKLNETALGVTLYQEDCFTMIPQLEDGSIALLITDPPYNTTEHEWDKIGTRDEFLDFTRRWLNSVKTKLAANYHMFIFCDPDYQADIEILLRNQGWPLKSRIVWANRSLPNGRNISDKFASTYQMAYHCGNHDLNWSPEWSDERFDVQIIAAPNSNMKDGGYHPTPKPEKLIEHFIRIGSTIGDTVLDIFAGGGTVGASSATVGQRRCILIEKEDAFCTNIEKRLNIKREDNE